MEQVRRPSYHPIPQLDMFSDTATSVATTIVASIATHQMTIDQTEMSEESSEQMEMMNQQIQQEIGNIPSDATEEMRAGYIDWIEKTYKPNYTTWVKTNNAKLSSEIQVASSLSIIMPRIEQPVFKTFYQHKGEKEMALLSMALFPSKFDKLMQEEANKSARIAAAEPVYVTKKRPATDEKTVKAKKNKVSSDKVSSDKVSSDKVSFDKVSSDKPVVSTDKPPFTPTNTLFRPLDARIIDDATVGYKEFRFTKEPLVYLQNTLSSKTNTAELINALKYYKSKVWLLAKDTKESNVLWIMNDCMDEPWKKSLFVKLSESFGCRAGSIKPGWFMGGGMGRDILMAKPILFTFLMEALTFFAYCAKHVDPELRRDWILRVISQLSVPGNQVGNRNYAAPETKFFDNNRLEAGRAIKNQR
jgi:hypothetical protein